MSLWDAVTHRLRVLLRPDAYAREIAEEHEFHLALDAMRREAEGRGAVSPDEARHAARRRFGNSTLMHEDTRTMAGLGTIETTRQDLRFALRSFLRTPGFTIVAILTLAIGIGANTVVFSAIDALLLRPLPYPHPERLMKVSLTRPPRGENPANNDALWSYPKYDVFRKNQQVFSSLALHTWSEATFRTTDYVERMKYEMTESDYFRALGVQPLLGRVFAPDEQKPGGPKVVLLSYSLWQRVFNADSAIVGKSIGISGSPHVIIGVMPAGFKGLSGIGEFWIPVLDADPTSVSEPWSHGWTQVARLRDGVTIEQAKAAVRQLGDVVQNAYPDPELKNERHGAIARELDATRVDPLVKKSLLILAGAVGLVLLIACANVANLFLVRSIGRRHEIALRLSLGATRARLVRQLITESLCLTAAGGLAGVALAWVGVHFLSVLDPARALNVRRLEGIGAIGFDSIRMNTEALAVAAALSVLTGVLFGLVPALGATRESLNQQMKTGRNRVRHGAFALMSARNVLVTTEIAMAVILLAGSGLMIRSLAKLLAIEPGFASEQLLSMRLNVREGSKRDSLPIFYEQVMERLSSLPGVTGVTIEDCPPFNGGCNGTVVWRRDRPPAAAGTEPEVGVHWIAPNWSQVMGVPLLKGRTFDSGDRLGTRKVVLISAAAAQRVWPGEDPLGKPVSVGQGGFSEDTAYVIGVVGDLRYDNVESKPRADVYLSHLQSPRGRMMIMVRTNNRPEALINSVRTSLHEFAPDLPLYDVRTMASRIADSTAYARFGAMVLTMFSGIALLLATIGTYGVMAFSVSQRRREIGIRMALGARVADVVNMILAQGLGVAIIGAAAGLGGALAATSVLKAMLYEVKPTDSATLASIVVLLLTAVMIACWIPARRAANVEPTEALREE